MEEVHEKENFQFRNKGIFEKFKNFKFSLSILTFYFETLNDSVEKIVTLFKWKDEMTSFVFLIIFIVIFLVVTFLPIRYFAILGCNYIFLTF